MRQGHGAAAPGLAGCGAFIDHGACRCGFGCVKIGVISDTHGLLRPEAEQRLVGVAHIIHAGDIGLPEIIAGLCRIAPVIAIKGNVDTADWAACYPATRTLELGGRSIHVVHDVNDLELDPRASGIEMVISGHSHRPAIETVDGVLYLNPGSAGPRRFSLPVTLAIVELSRSGVRPVIHELLGQGKTRAPKN